MRCAARVGRAGVRAGLHYNGGAIGVILVHRNIVDGASNLRWLQVFSAGADSQRYHNAFAHGVRVITSAGTNGEPVTYTAFTELWLLRAVFRTGS